MKPTLLTALISVVFTTPHVLGGASELDALEARLAEQERLIQQLQQENRALRSPQEPASKPAAAAATTSAKTYTVQPGDSLERIARRNQTTPAAIAQTNRLKLTSVIYAGQKLQLPASEQTLAKSESNKPAIPSGNKHTIREGETYFSISRKHGTTVNALVAANPQIKPTALRPGQVIRLAPPTAATTPVLNTKSKAPVATSSPAPKPAPTPPTAPAAKASGADAEVSLSDQHTASKQPEKKIRSVLIEGEMTYGEFAAKHGTDTDRLNGLNGLDLTTATVLAKGSELYVPAQP